MALRCLNEAARRSSHDALRVASCFHALALTYSAIGGFRDALHFERRSHTLYTERLGAQHAVTLEAANCALEISRISHTHILKTQIAVRFDEGVGRHVHFLALEIDQGATRVFADIYCARTTAAGTLCVCARCAMCDVGIREMVAGGNF